MVLKPIGIFNFWSLRLCHDDDELYIARVFVVVVVIIVVVAVAVAAFYCFESLDQSAIYNSVRSATCHQF